MHFSLKRFTAKLIFKTSELTSRFRLLPSFIIIGAQKCGTSSLYHYLVKHPSIFPARRKEIHFFDEESFSKGIRWYKAHFALSAYARLWSRRIEAKVITGEASPYYLAFPAAPERIATVLPNVKLIVMLRNPTDRAFSHYHHQVRHGREPLSFEKAIEAEGKRIEGEEKKMFMNNNYYSYNFWAFSYLARGVYINQLENWMRFFHRQQILVIKSEDFFSTPEKELRRSFEFLGLPDVELGSYPKVNAGDYDKMAEQTRKNLTAYFKPYNERLYEWLEEDYLWN